MFSCIAGRRRLWSILGATILILFILSCADDDTVNQIQTDDINYSKWMSLLDDDTLAYKVSLPSSHDSACWNDNLTPRGRADSHERHWAVTQYDDIEKQWDAGARGFDLRTYWETNERNGVKGNIGVAHGSGHYWFESKKLFEELFADIVDLLDEHPTEFVFIRVAIERDITEENHDAINYVDAVNELMKDNKDYIYGTPDIKTTVKELRGKMVLLPAVIAGKGGLPDGYKDPFLHWGPKLDEFYNPKYNPVDNHDPDRLIQNFKDIDSESNGPGFGFGESNHPGDYPHDPEYFAPAIQTKLIDFLTGADGQKLRHIGVLNIDFICTGTDSTKNDGERLAHNVILVNFRK